MISKQVIIALDILVEYPAIREYIQQFNGNHGFVYTIETEPTKIELKKQMEDLLDDGSHSGASWGEMMRYIQAVLNGVISREDIMKNINKEEEYYNQWLLEKSREDQEENTYVLNQ